MEFGLGGLARAITLPTFGKRDMRDDVGEQVDKNEHKRGKVVNEEGVSDDLSAGVDSHPCRKRSGEANTKIRLDRAVANKDWIGKFQMSKVLHLSTHASDHLPILLQVQFFVPQRREKGFNFEESWLLMEDSEAMIKEASDSELVVEQGLASTLKKIQVCGLELMKWGSARTTPDEEAIKQIQKRLGRLNKEEMTSDSKAEYLELNKKMDEFLQKQEIYWAQKSRISWLQHGNKNTKFFHSTASQMRRKNHIQGIKNSQRQWVEELEEVVVATFDYFQTLFQAGACDRMEECLDAVPQMVTEEMQEALSWEFIVEDVKVTLFHIGPIKAPRTDGMNALFFQKFWHIVGDDVVIAVLDFLNNGHMLPEINHTNIVLIPKVLPYIISPTQSAFVPGRLITDNVLVAYETLHTMHARKKGKKVSLALKLDVSKAYDCVEWQFLRGIMEKMGFPALWIERVISCVTTPTFSILNEGQAVREILQTYAQASRQCVNLEKSSVYFSSNTTEAKELPGCSYVWRSILAALPILRLGSCWRVGNGSSISVVRDRWLPNHPTNKILYPRHELVEDLAVSDFSDPELHLWRRDMIMGMFHSEDVEAIFRIPLSRRSVPDSILWLHNKNGKFSVKSAYKLARQIQLHGDRAETSSGCARKKIWPVLWKLKIPNKVKIFGWRACHDILPTSYNLSRRRIITEDKCQLCTKEVETTVHALWECAVVQDVWVGSISKLQKGPSVFRDTLQLMEFLVDRLTVEELELFWVLAWIIWNQRNCVVHGDQLKDPKCLNKRAKDFVLEFQQAQWQPPPPDVYKLNFDAIVFLRLNKIGIGTIIRNDKGEVMAAMSAIGPCAKNNEEAKLMAYRRSLEFAVDAEFSSLIIKGDNANVIQAISSSLPNHSILGCVVDDIRHLIHGLYWARTNQIRRGREYSGTCSCPIC
ncbi:uncharacterized protein LOC142609203 [Castanea sativa]|uniref:uncharacterized protein LOC142609203 n=1 Tax=Castanea sativa TaxID=21020 RepID=UPI003F64F895